MAVLSAAVFQRAGAVALCGDGQPRCRQVNRRSGARCRRQHLSDHAALSGAVVRRCDGRLVVVSRLFGAGRKGDVRAAASTALLASAVFCVILTLLGLLGCGALLRLIQTPEDVFSLSKQYLYLYTAGLLPLYSIKSCSASSPRWGTRKRPPCFSRSRR